MFRAFLNGFTGLLGAALSSQFPAYYADYQQRLGGRLDQARIQVERLEAAARAEGVSLADYIDAFVAGASAHRRQGGLMLEQLADLERLRSAAEALGRAMPWQRPLRFAEHVDGGVARATLDIFEPSLPLSLEGAAYAAAGLLLGLGTLALTRGALRPLLRRRRPA